MYFPEESSPKSLLEDIHQHFLNSAKTFKDLVCQDCGFSNATYYRKLISNEYTTISRAERKAIIRQAEYLVNRITDCINQHKD